MDEMQRAFEEWSSVYYADTDFTKVTENDEEFDFGWLYKDNMTQLSWEAWRKSWQAATMAERERAAQLILCDACAITHQTMGQYRTAMAKAIRSRTE